jgi:hypothetical protein
MMTPMAIAVMPWTWAKSEASSMVFSWDFLKGGVKRN